MGAIRFAVDGKTLRKEHHSALALVRFFGRLESNNDQGGVVVGLIDRWYHFGGESSGSFVALLHPHNDDLKGPILRVFCKPFGPEGEIEDVLDDMMQPLHNLRRGIPDLHSKINERSHLL